MPTVADLIYGILLPAAVAAAVALAVVRGTSRSDARAAGVAGALVIGFVVGYGLLGLGPLQPATHWHWLPWTAVLSLLAAAVPPFGGHRWWLFILLSLAVSAVSGWLLVPDWPDLAPSREVHWAIWTGYVAIVASLLSAIVSHQRLADINGPTAAAGLPTVWVALVMGGTLLAAAGVLMASGSMRFAQMAGCTAGAALGVACAAAIDPRRVDLSRLPLPLTVIAAGAMLVGRVNSYSEVPLLCYALVPLAPLALGLAASGPLQRMSRRGRVAATVGAAVAVGALAVVIAVAAEWPLTAA